MKPYQEKRIKPCPKFEENKELSQVEEVKKSRWSLTRIISKSRIYQWLMYGMSAVKSVAPGIMLSMLYDGFQRWAFPSVPRPLSQDPVLQKIMNTGNMTLSNLTSLTQGTVNFSPIGIGAGALSASIPNLMLKYSSYVNVYIDKLRSEATSEVTWAATTTKLVLLCIGSLAYFLYIMKTKKSTIFPVEEEQKMAIEQAESDDEGNSYVIYHRLHVHKRNGPHRNPTRWRRW